MLWPKICGWHTFSIESIEAELQDGESWNAAQCMLLATRKNILRFLLRYGPQWNYSLTFDLLRVCFPEGWELLHWEDCCHCLPCFNEDKRWCLLFEVSTGLAPYSMSVRLFWGKSSSVFSSSQLTEFSLWALNYCEFSNSSPSNWLIVIWCINKLAWIAHLMLYQSKVKPRLALSTDCTCCVSNTPFPSSWPQRDSVVAGEVCENWTS